MGKETKKNLILIVGMMFTVIGSFMTIPFILEERYLPGGIALFFVIIGMILLAIALGDTLD